MALGVDPFVSSLMPGAVKHYIATGDSGQGMTGGSIAGMVLHDLIMGVRNPWQDIYSPSRLPALSLETGQNLVHEASVTMESYLERVSLRGVQDVKGVLSPSSVEGGLARGEGGCAVLGVSLLTMEVMTPPAASFRPAGQSLKKKHAFNCHQTFACLI